jgi:hypothetical protein
MPRAAFDSSVSLLSSFVACFAIATLFFLRVPVWVSPELRQGRMDLRLQRTFGSFGTDVIRRVFRCLHRPST